MEVRGIAPVILNPELDGGWVVSFTSRPLCPWVNSQQCRWKWDCVGRDCSEKRWNLCLPEWKSDPKVPRLIMNGAIPLLQNTLELMYYNWQGMRQEWAKHEQELPLAVTEGKRGIGRPKMRLLVGVDQHSEVIGERNWNRQAAWMEEASEEGQGPPGAVEPMVMMVMYLYFSYVPSRFESGLKFFIFTWHGIKPHYTSTAKLKVSHCTDWNIAASVPLKGRAWFGWYSTMDGRMVREY